MNKSMFIAFLVLIIGISSCTVLPQKVTGTFISNCRLYGFPKVIITLDANKTFTCEYPYLKGMVITGVWELKGDTLIIKSQYVVGVNKKEVVTTEDTFAHFPNYLVKRQKLFELEPFRKINKNCYFKKQKVTK